jgi:hypothetical protein
VRYAIAVAVYLFVTEVLIVRSTHHEPNNNAEQGLLDSRVREVGGVGARFDVRRRQHQHGGRKRGDSASVAAIEMWLHNFQKIRKEKKEKCDKKRGKIQKRANLKKSIGGGNLLVADPRT